MVDTISKIHRSIDTIYIENYLKIDSLNSNLDKDLWYNNPNTIIALLAILISVFGLIFSVIYNRKTENITKKHNQLTVRPLLLFYQSVLSKEGIVKIELFNNGIGPGIINKTTYKFENVYFDNMEDMLSAIVEIFMPKIKIKMSNEYSEIMLKEVIPSNSSKKILQIRIEPIQYIDELCDLLEKVCIIITYNDLYDNEFSTNIKSTHTTNNKFNAVWRVV